MARVKFEEPRIRDNPNFRRIENTKYFVNIFGEVWKELKDKDIQMATFWKRQKGKSKSFITHINNKQYVVAQLVWRAFNGDYDGKKYCVVHKNRCKTDNNLYNLKLEERSKLGVKYGGCINRRANYIYCVETGKRYRGYAQAGKDLHIARETARQYALGKTKKPMYHLYIMKDKPYVARGEE